MSRLQWKESIEVGSNRSGTRKSSYYSASAKYKSA